MSRPELPDGLPAPVTDSHCHLDMARDGDDPLSVPEAVRLASEVGVSRIVQIGCDLAGAEWAVTAANSNDALVAGVALHPNEAPTLAAEGRLDAALDRIEELAASSERVRAIGETGLDYFRTTSDGWRQQEESFRAHIEMAKRLDRTLVIHDRDAHEDILRVLSEVGSPDRVVMHCYSGDTAMAVECVRRGYWLSIAGTVTFKNAGVIRDALRATPIEHLLVETDAPFLTPAPHRGSTNASYLIPLTMRAIAQVKEVEMNVLCTAIQANSDRAFGVW